MLKKFFRKNFLLILILLVSAFLRFYRIADYMEFLGDQGRDVTIIRDFLKNGNLFFIGPQTSIGNMYLGPYFYYFIAPSLLFSRFNPIGPAVFVGLISLATVYLVYFVSKKWFNKNTGYIASFLFGISPIVIKYSNFIWNPNIMPFFTLLFVFLFFEAFRKENYKYFIYATLAFVMVINSHYLGLAILPFVGIYWLIQLYKYIKFKSPLLKSFLIYSIISFLVFAVSLTPQLLFEFKHNFQNSRALINFFTYRETTISIKPYKSIPKLPALFNQVNTRLLAGKNEIAGVITSVIFIICIIFIFLKSKDKKIKYFYLCLVWYIVGLVCLALYKQHIYDHYFGFLFPVVFILFAYLINRMKKVGIILLIFITIFSILENPFRWEPNYQLKTTQQVVNSITTKSNSQDFNFASLSKMGWGYSYYLTENKNYYEINNKLTNQLFVACYPFQIECNPINNPEYNIAAFGWAKIDSEWEINGIKVFKLIPNPEGKK